MAKQKQNDKGEEEKRPDFKKTTEYRRFQETTEAGCQSTSDAKEGHFPSVNVLALPHTWRAKVPENHEQVSVAATAPD